ncbi:MAG: sensor histidine kinase [Egibacteraceae bacterium]
MNAWIERATAAFARRPGLVDGALCAVLLIAALAVAAFEFRYVGNRQGDLLPPVPWSPMVGAAIVAIVAPLAWRRRAPLTVLALVATAQVAALALLRLENEITLLAVLAAMYSAGAHGAEPGRKPLRVIAFGALAVALTYQVDADQPVGAAIYSLHLVVWGVAACVLGDSVRIGRAREAELETRTAQLAAEREINARRAVLEERVRVARELHDVIAHHVSLMGIQAAAAGRVLTTRPEQAAKTLASIEGTSRQAVGEMQRMLGFLRQEDEVDALAPPPSLRRLGSLVTQMSEAKLAVEVCVEGDQKPLPASVDLSAYRVVQEALTNTLKHAKATTAAVTLRYRTATFEVEVVDNGVGTAAVPNIGNGQQQHGLIGMRERAALHCGEFEAGPRAEGGFGVRASFLLLERS